MDIWYIIAQALIGFIIINLSLVAVAYVIYFERKVSAHMQARIGPNRAGPLGLFQSFADLIKMLKKEDTTPKIRTRQYSSSRPWSAHSRCSAHW